MFPKIRAETIQLGFDFIFRMMNLRNYKPLFISRITNLCKCRNCETDFNFRMMNITSFSELRTSSQMILWRKKTACKQIDGGTVQLTMHVSLSADNSICLTWLSEPSIIYPVESITMQPKRTIDWSIKFVISITIFSYLKTKIRNQPSESHITSVFYPWSIWRALSQTTTKIGHAIR